MKSNWNIGGWVDKLESWLNNHAWAQKLWVLMPHKYLKRLDYYIMAKFLGTYIFAIALIISIAVVFDFNEKMDRFMEHDAPWSAIIFDYYKNFIPYFANLFSPLFVFIAVIFFTAKMAENSEIIAMFSTGMSFKRMLRPYMVSAAIISIVTFFLGAYIIPNGSVTRINFEDKYYKERKLNTARNIQMEVDTNVVAYIERYEDKQRTKQIGKIRNEILIVIKDDGTPWGIMLHETVHLLVKVEYNSNRNDQGYSKDIGTQKLGHDIIVQSFQVFVRHQFPQFLSPCMILRPRLQFIYPTSYVPSNFHYNL